MTEEKQNSLNINSPSIGPSTATYWSNTFGMENWRFLPNGGYEVPNGGSPYMLYGGHGGEGGSGGGPGLTTGGGAGGGGEQTTDDYSQYHSFESAEGRSPRLISCYRMLVNSINRAHEAMKNMSALRKERTKNLMDDLTKSSDSAREVVLNDDDISEQDFQVVERCLDTAQDCLTRLAGRLDDIEDEHKMISQLPEAALIAFRGENYEWKHFKDNVIKQLDVLPDETFKLSTLQDRLIGDNPRLVECKDAIMRNARSLDQAMKILERAFGDDNFARMVELENMKRKLIWGASTTAEELVNVKAILNYVLYVKQMKMLSEIQGGFVQEYCVYLTDDQAKLMREIHDESKTDQENVDILEKFLSDLMTSSQSILLGRKLLQPDESDD